MPSWGGRLPTCAANETVEKCEKKLRRKERRESVGGDRKSAGRKTRREPQKRDGGEISQADESMLGSAQQFNVLFFLKKNVIYKFIHTYQFS